MLKFYYDPAYKYTNRTIIDLTGDSNYTEHDYENIDSPDTINGHIIYTLTAGENIPTYVYDTESYRRWFVSGITQLRTGKFQISLLRDIISESPNIWKQEQAYITAGTATNYNRYKRWNLPYTNTKIREERLNINGESSFFVFYVNEQHENNGVISEQDLNIKYSAIPGIGSVDYTFANIADIPSYQYLNAGNVYNIANEDRSCEITSYFLVRFGFVYASIPERVLFSNYQLTDVIFAGEEEGYLKSNIREHSIKENTNNCKTNMETAVFNYLDSYINSTYPSQISTTNINNLEPYVGKIIYISSTNKAYKVRKNVNYIQPNTMLAPATLYSALRSISYPDGDNFTEATGNWFKFTTRIGIYNYVLEEIGTATSFDFNFRADVRKLPKSAVRCVNIVPDSNTNKEELAQCLMLAQTNGINADNTTGRILDIQYLPFSVADSTLSNFVVNNNNLTAQFLSLDDFIYNINLTDLTDINKETDTIKIVSPSRASQLLFRPYDNNGNMEFGVNITLKPFASTIYVRPSTKGLLKYDWNDKDCLVIQEDFSLTNVTSEWTQYVYQNKTYSSVFERQIQGREFERSWERQVEAAQAKSDEWNARNISAQKAKAATFNIPIISGIAAGIATIQKDPDYMRAAQVDREYNEALYNEGMSLSRDLFEYQIENIKSQPLIPSKITTIDCKFLDGIYLEFYSTNETELEAIKKFYYYNGNRIDDYGTFEDYWGNFVKGKIIISYNYTQPEIDELNRRLSMGIFTGGVL